MIAHTVGDSKGCLMSDASCSLSRRQILRAACGAALAGAWIPAGVFAQDQLPMGFARLVPGVATGEELARQPELWVMDIAYKPMRLMFVDILDPATGKKERKQIWYLAYRVVRRPVQARDAGDVEPVNPLEPVPGKPKFLPQFTLVTYENRQTEIPTRIQLDMIIPEAMAAINKVERPYTFQDSVHIVQDLPAEVAADVADPPYIYGVAVWQGIDPQTDFFKVIVSGLTNIYESRGAEGEVPTQLRKVLVQKFHRRGDQFDPDIREFEFDGAAAWEYQPDRPTEVAAAPETNK